MLESQRGPNRIVINQRPFYFNWLIDHKAEFQLLVQHQLGHETAKKQKTVTDYLAQSGQTLTDRYEKLRAFLLSLGDDVQEKTLKYYVAFKRIKNFACVEVHPKSGELLVYLKVDPDTVDLDDPTLRDVRAIGHFGTGDLEVRIASDHDLNRAQPLFVKSYETS